MNEIARNNPKDGLSNRSFNNKNGSKMKNKSSNKNNKRKSKWLSFFEYIKLNGVEYYSYKQEGLEFHL